jgi:hypothetical protein
LSGLEIGDILILTTQTNKINPETKQQHPAVDAITHADYGNTCINKTHIISIDLLCSNPDYYGPIDVYYHMKNETISSNLAPIEQENRTVN